MNRERNRFGANIPFARSNNRGRGHTGIDVSSVVDRVIDAFLKDYLANSHFKLRLDGLVFADVLLIGNAFDACYRQINLNLERCFDRATVVAQTSYRRNRHARLRVARIRNDLEVDSGHQALDGNRRFDGGARIGAHRLSNCRHAGDVFAFDGEALVDGSGIIAHPLDAHPIGARLAIPAERGNDVLLFVEIGGSVVFPFYQRNRFRADAPHRQTGDMPSSVVRNGIDIVHLERHRFDGERPLRAAYVRQRIVRHARPCDDNDILADVYKAFGSDRVARRSVDVFRIVRNMVVSAVNLLLRRIQHRDFRR